MRLHKAQVHSQSDQVTNTWRTLVSVDAAIIWTFWLIFHRLHQVAVTPPPPNSHTDHVTYDITSMITFSDAASRLKRVVTGETVASAVTSRVNHCSWSVDDDVISACSFIQGRNTPHLTLSEYFVWYIRRMIRASNESLGKVRNVTNFCFHFKSDQESNASSTMTHHLKTLVT